MNVSSAAFIAPIPKIFVIKVAILQVSTETQSIGIHDVHLFNTELAMHYRAIFNCDYFRLFCERDRVCSRVLVYISRIKSKTGPERQLFSV